MNLSAVAVMVTALFVALKMGLFKKIEQIFEKLLILFKLSASIYVRKHHL